MTLRLFSLIAFSLCALADNSFSQEKGKLITKVYPVQDLVSSVPTDANGKRLEPDISKMASDLTKLIENTIKPDSWTDRGGPGTVDYYPIGGGLVVHQSTEVQEQVAGLLEALRKLQDRQVCCELRVLSIPEEVYSNFVNGKCCDKAQASHFANHWLVHRCAYMQQKEVDYLVKAMKGQCEGMSCLTSPKLTLFDGQKGFVCVGDDKESVKLFVNPRLSADQQAVGVHFQMSMKGVEEETTACLRDGTWWVFGGWKVDKKPQEVPNLNKIPYLSRLFKNPLGSERIVVMLKASRVMIEEKCETSHCDGGVGCALGALVGTPPNAGIGCIVGGLVETKPVLAEPLKSIRVRVQTTPTGTCLPGVGVNSDAGITGTIVLNERNFNVLAPAVSACCEVTQVKSCCAVESVKPLIHEVAEMTKADVDIGNILQYVSMQEMPSRITAKEIIWLKKQNVHATVIERLMTCPVTAKQPTLPRVVTGEEAASFVPVSPVLPTYSPIPSVPFTMPTMPTQFTWKASPDPKVLRLLERYYDACQEGDLERAKKYQKPLREFFPEGDFPSLEDYENGNIDPSCPRVEKLMSDSPVPPPVRFKIKTPDGLIREGMEFK